MKAVKGRLNFYQVLLHFYFFFYCYYYYQVFLHLLQVEIMESAIIIVLKTQEDKTFCWSLSALLNFI